VSNHFHRHSVWDVILRGILVNLDRERFEVVLYNLGHIEDEETKLAKSLSDLWRDSRSVSGLDGWLKAVAADRPDAIFYPEIGMEHLTLRLASRRLARFSLPAGTPITTGLPTIDLFFSGELIEPPEADSHYRERLVRLPGTGCCTSLSNLSRRTASVGCGPGKAPWCALCHCQRFFKFDPGYDALFADIAAATAHALLS